MALQPKDIADFRRNLVSLGISPTISDAFIKAINAGQNTWRTEAMALDSSSTSLPTSGSYMVDGYTPEDGDRILFTGLSDPGANNKVYTVEKGGSLSWTLETDGAAGDGSATKGDALYVKNGVTSGGYVWIFGGSSWGKLTGAASITIGTFDSQTPGSDGLVASGLTVYGQSASTTNPGMVNTAAQTFAGTKTFKNGIVIPSLELAGATSGSLTFNVPASFSTYSLLLPANQGSGFLENDGLGNLSWGTPTPTDSFTIWQTPFGTSPTAGTSTSTMDLTASASDITITGNAVANSLDFKLAKTPINADGSTTPTADIGWGSHNIKNCTGIFQGNVNNTGFALGFANDFIGIYGGGGLAAILSYSVGHKWYGDMWSDTDGTHDIGYANGYGLDRRFRDLRLGGAYGNYSQRVVATTGGSTTVNDHVSSFVFAPAGTLASYTLTMPAAPWDGLILHITSSQTITALTLSPNTGQTINGAITTISATTPATYQFIKADNAWYRMG